MLRDILYNKWIIGAIGLLIISAIGCYLWYQHTTAPYRAQAAKAEELLHQWETKKAQTKNAAETVLQKAPAESTMPTAERQTIIIGEETTETNTDKPSKTVTVATTEIDNTEEVRISPHGFGTYPEIPEDFPENVDWSNYEGKLPIYELMVRVQIKLWKQGHHTEGIVEENGVLYPIRRSVVYIKWSDNGKDIIDIIGHPKDLSDDIVDQMYESGTVPAGFTVFDYDKANIDPYKFLNLLRA